MKGLLITLIFGFCFISCNKKEKKTESFQEPTKKVFEDEVKTESFSINIEQALKEIKNERFPFSALGSEIEYIPLETTSASLLGGGRFGIQAHLVSNKIILVSMKCFDRQTGRYLGELMQKGEGPEEYLWVTSCLADDEREEFYLFDQSKGQIHIVGYDRTFKKSIASGHDITIYSLGNGYLLIGRGNNLENSYDDYYIINIDTKETVSKRRSSALTNIKTLDECAGLFKGGKSYWTIGYNKFWKYKDRIHYYDCLTDSVYSISKTLEVEALGVILMGNLKLTKEQAYIRPRNRDFTTWYMGRIVETDKYILIHMFSLLLKPTSQREACVLVYSKEDKQVVAYREPEEDYPFKNDLDNTVSFFLNQAECSPSLYGLIPIEAIKERAMKPFSEKGKPFKKMADKLKFDDNEVIGILK